VSSTVMRRTGFGMLCVLSAGVVAYAIGAYGFMSLGSLVHPDMRAVFESHRIGIYSHIFGSSLALAIGPLQFWTRLRTTKRSVHRWLGRLYLGLGVLIGGTAGLWMAFHAWGGLMARLGFACLAIAWLYSGLRAWLAVRAGNLAMHRTWMIRNFSLTFAAVTLRLYLPIAGAAGIGFDVAYPAIAWLCWLPNLAIAEWSFNRSR
jgi:uncharacterized membrane protein